MKTKKYFLPKPVKFDLLCEAAEDKGFVVKGNKLKYFIDSEGQKHHLLIKDGMVTGFAAPSYPKKKTEQPMTLKEKRQEENRQKELKGPTPKKYYQRVAEIGRFFDDIGHQVARTKENAELGIGRNMDFEPQDSSLPAIELTLNMKADIKEYEVELFKEFLGRGDEIYTAYIKKNLHNAEKGLTPDEIDELVRQSRDGELTSYSELKTAITKAADRSLIEIEDTMKQRVAHYSFSPIFPDLNKFIELLIESLANKDDQKALIMDASVLLHNQRKEDLEIFLCPVKELLPRLYEQEFKNFENSPKTY